MSTRSGKRIHSLISENVESVLEIQIERKTRSKRVKEIGDEVPTAKKKRNFVRLPFDDEDESLNDKTEKISKSACKSRRQTLKELNIPKEEDKEALNDRKSMRQSRRIRKKETVEPTNVQETDKISKEKKKNKKKKAIIENLENDPVKVIILPKKKTSKKKKKSNSFIVEELVTGEHTKSCNKSNMSIDSFHSAAGSPGEDNFNNEPINDDKTVKNKERKTNSSLISFSENTKKKSKKTEKDNYFETSSNMSVKLSASNESFESSICKMGNIENKNGNRFEKEISASLKTKSKKNKSKQPKLLSDLENTQTKPKLTRNVERNNSFEVNQVTDLNSSIEMKPIANIHKMKTSTSNVDFVIPHVNGTTNSLESFSLNNSSKKGNNPTSKNSTFENIDTSMKLLNECSTEISDNLLIEKVTVNRTSDSQNIRMSNSKDSTYEKINLSDTNLNQSVDQSNNSFNKNYNADKELSRRESGIKNTTYDKIEENLLDMDTMIIKESSNNKTHVKSSKVSLSQNEVPTILNGTYDKINTDDNTSFCNNTNDKPKLNNTFEKSNNALDENNITNLDSISSITSSDNTDNMTSDISEDRSRISITSDDSRTDNIVNTTPLLIESSMDESEINSASILNKTPTPQKEQAISKIITPEKQSSLFENTKTPLKRDDTYTELRRSSSKRRTTITEYSGDSEFPTTPLKREGTFTKESSDERSSKCADRTPTRRESMSSPGRTPFASSRSGSKGRVALNVTHSIEKPHRRSSEAAAPPRLTKVMFRSPVDDPVAVAKMKGKVIKSNLKGSNKSFMFDESVSSQGGGSRKRSRKHCEADEGVQRTRIRTSSATARLQAPSTPLVSKPDPKLRTRLPDFAALHQKQFSKMESLDECQRRRARRARALLTPTTTGHNVTADEAKSQAAKRPAVTQSKDIDKKNATQSYTRFGFKLNLDVNPFSVPAKTAEVKTKVLKRQATLPSLAGTTLRKEVAKQTVMREKSFTDKRDAHRDQNRTVIKGVRTNRRFELQMKMRNIN